MYLSLLQTNTSFFDKSNDGLIFDATDLLSCCKKMIMESPAYHSLSNQSVQLRQNNAMFSTKMSILFKIWRLCYVKFYQKYFSSQIIHLFYMLSL